MSKGFHSQFESLDNDEKSNGDIRDVANEIVKITKEVRESVESRGIYNSQTLDEQLSSQIEEMKKEQERLEGIKQKEEKVEDKNNKSRDCENEYER